jgi:hypothetical protein
VGTTGPWLYPMATDSLCACGRACGRVLFRARQMLGVDAQYTIFELLHGNYELSMALTSRTCDALVRAVTAKGFDASFLLPLGTVMCPDGEPVKAVQRLVLKALLDPLQLHGLFSRRQLFASGSGEEVVVIDLMWRLVRSLGIHPQALARSAAGGWHPWACSKSKPPSHLSPACYLCDVPPTAPY